MVRIRLISSQENLQVFQSCRGPRTSAFPCCLSKTLPGSCVRSGPAETWTGAGMRLWHHSKKLNLLCHHTGPTSFHSIGNFCYLRKKINVTNLFWPKMCLLDSKLWNYYVILSIIYQLQLHIFLILYYWLHKRFHFQKTWKSPWCILVHRCTYAYSHAYNCMLTVIFNNFSNFKSSCLCHF